MRERDRQRECGDVLRAVYLVLLCDTTPINIYPCREENNQSPMYRQSQNRYGNWNALRMESAPKSPSPASCFFYLLISPWWLDDARTCRHLVSADQQRKCHHAKKKYLNLNMVGQMRVRCTLCICCITHRLRRIGQNPALRQPIPIPSTKRSPTIR